MAEKTETRTPRSRFPGLLGFLTSSDLICRQTNQGKTAMADKTKPDSSEEPQADTATVTKLPQSVEMKDVGPCKKHIKVTVERDAIDKRLNEKFSELVVDA